MSWGYFIHIPEAEQTGTEIGYSGFPSSLLSSSQWREQHQTCWPLKQTHLWYPAPAVCCDSLMDLGACSVLLVHQSALTLPTKPSHQPPPLTWHKAGTDTLWWSFCPQTNLQLYVNARLQTSVNGILIFVLVVNLHQQFCSADSDQPLHPIFIQAELEMLSWQSVHLWKEGLSLWQLDAKGGREMSN